MKAGTQNHLKVRRLKRLLGVPIYQAVGILETIWLLCSDCCDQGNIGKFTDEEIADYLEWEGSPEVLVKSLIDAGWVDEHKDYRLVIHDWLEHCPEFVRERVRKRHMREAKAGRKPSSDQEIRTYVSSEADKPGTNPDKGGTAADKTGQGRDKPPLVPSIPNPTQPNPTNSIPTTVEPTETPPPPVGGSSNGRKRQSVFVAPTVEEVAAYCRDRKNGVNPQYFVDHYAARGWVLSNGKKCQDWQACVRTWEQRSGQFGTNATAPSTPTEPAQPDEFALMAAAYRATRKPREHAQ